MINTRSISKVLSNRKQKLTTINILYRSTTTELHCNPELISSTEPQNKSNTVNDETCRFCLLPHQISSTQTHAHTYILGTCIYKQKAYRPNTDQLCIHLRNDRSKIILFINLLPKQLISYFFNKFQRNPWVCPYQWEKPNQTYLLVNVFPLDSISRLSLISELFYEDRWSRIRV